MSVVNKADVHRYKYWKGQSLRGRDFRSQITTEEQLRRWHNRALHTSFGIVEGLRAKRDEKTVVVSAGLAYDCHGGLLYLARDAVLPFPSESSSLQAEWILLLQHDPTTRLCWKQVDHVVATHGVPLAKLIYRMDTQDFELMEIPSKVRAFMRPHIGFGTTIPGHGWEMWELDNQEQRILGLKIKIDTTAAGFTEVPCYFASLSRVPSLAGLSTQEVYQLLAALLFQQLTEVSLEGFTLQIFVPENQSALLDLIQKYKLVVFWIGVQSPFGHPRTELGRTHHGNH